jgi:hypothetical protein
MSYQEQAAARIWSDARYQRFLDELTSVSLDIRAAANASVREEKRSVKGRVLRRPRFSRWRIDRPWHVLTICCSLYNFQNNYNTTAILYMELRRELRLPTPEGALLCGEKS